MANFYDAFARGQANGLERQKAVTQRNMLAELQQIGPQVIAGDLAATDRAYALDPQRAQAFQAEGNRQQQQLFGLAKSLKQSAANPQMQAGIYRSAVPFLKRSFGAEIPDEFDATSVMPIVDQVLAVAENAPAMAGVGASQNKVVGGALVTPDGRVVYEAPVNGQIVDVPDGMRGSNKMIFDPRTRSLSPLPGAAGGAAAATGATVLRGNNGEVIDLSKVTEPGLREAITQNPEAWGLIPDGANVLLPDRQVRSGGFGYTPPAPSMTPYQASQDSRADRAEARAEQAASEAAEDRRMRRDEKAADQRRAVESAVASYDDALGTIQRLRAHPGFRSLGTIAGDAAIAAPLVRNDAKGANAVLETIRNQSLINTLSALKAASSTGASGFGSLTEKEGAALQGAITNLQTAQSHEDLDQSLRELERVITRNRSMAVNKIQSYQQPQPGQREQGGAIRIQSAADYNALPSGALFIAPDGTQRRKR